MKAFAIFLADDGCICRVQVGGFPREHCEHGRAYVLASICTEEAVPVAK